MSTSYENELVKLVDDHYIGRRVAGSFGSIDVFLFEPESYYMVQVKSVDTIKVGTVYYASNKPSEYAELCELRDKGYPVYYAVRWKRYNDYRGIDDMEKWDMYDPTETHIMRLGKGKKLYEVLGDDICE